MVPIIHYTQVTTNKFEQVKNRKKKNTNMFEKEKKNNQNIIVNPL
jgi:hypothetical protein